MADHIVVDKPVTIIHKLDDVQFASLIETLKSLAGSEPDQDVEALTAKLKASEEALNKAVGAAANPQT